MIPYGKQDISATDIDAVLSVLQSDFITQGPQVPLFEQTLADYCHAQHAVAVNSATSALHIACLALGVKPGDSVWTSPITFVASANAGLYCGATVDFVDVDPQSYCMSVESLKIKLQQAKSANKLPKVVIPVHFAGQSCDMEAIAELSSEYGFKIIEDAAHAIGGKYLGLPIGSCQYSDITVFSFHPVKIITTAEGGVATTNDSALAKKMQLLRSHGVTRDSELMTKASEGDWYYQQVDLGFNYRMTEMQAALGVSQMQRLDEFVAIRHQLADRYHKILAQLPLILPEQSEDSYSALHLYPIQIDDAKTAVSRKTVFDFLRKQGVGVNVHYIPVHLQPYYAKFGFKEGDFPVAEAYYQKAISIPLFSQLTHTEQDYVAAKLTEVLQ